MLPDREQKAEMLRPLSIVLEAEKEESKKNKKKITVNGWVDSDVTRHVLWHLQRERVVWFDHSNTVIKRLRPKLRLPWRFSCRHLEHSAPDRPHLCIIPSHMSRIPSSEL